MSSGASHRTGTIQFMAIEVLQGKGHTYQHDLEPLFYVFTWMCIRYGHDDRDIAQDSKLIPGRSTWPFSCGVWPMQLTSCCPGLTNASIASLAMNPSATITQHLQESRIHQQNAETSSRYLFPLFLNAQS